MAKVKKSNNYRAIQKMIVSELSYVNVDVQQDQT